LRGEEEQAKKCMRGHVKAALGLLYDEDPANDFQGYLNLMSILTSLDDDINALKAWSLLGPVEEKDKQQPNNVEAQDVLENQTGKDAQIKVDNVKLANKFDLEAPNGDHEAAETAEGKGLIGDTGAVPPKADSTNGKKDALFSHSPTTVTDQEVIATSGEFIVGGTSPTTATREERFSLSHLQTASLPSTPKTWRGDIHLRFDGQCGHTWTFADDIYVCRDCLDVQFEEGCLKKLREGTLERKICGKGHSFLHVPKWDDVEWSDVKIPEGVKQWLNEIRKEWDFETVE
jgi:hypothetical protein